jgi:hypothetical protein
LLAALVALTLAWGAAVSAATDAPDVSGALLMAEDIPAELSPGGVTHEPAFDFDTPSFDASGGLDKAAQTWQAAEVLPDMPVLVVFDFRFLFPDPDAAQAYLEAAEPILSESVTGITLQPDTPLVGDELRHYAGELSQGDLTIGVQNFLFRIGPVVAKVYVTGFGTSVEDGLTIAQAAAARTTAWLSEQPSASPPASPGQPSNSPSTSPTAEPAVDANAGAVRQWASGASASSQYGSDLWSALQATGEPDVSTYTDDPASWAPSGSDAGIQWLELTFDQAVVPSTVTIVESFGSGSVTLVEAFDPSTQGWVELWSGQSPATEAISTFSPPLSGVTFTTDRVRITLDTDLVPGYNEIDAVELVGALP